MRFFVACLLMVLCLKAEDDDALVNQAIKRHNIFRENYFRANEQDFIDLVKKGQSPKALFIGCSDSRVIPELITNSKPGDIFVIRTAGNFVSTYNPNIAWDGVAASIQYAVEVLKIKDIIVCGHSHCGAIDGVLNPNKVQPLQDVYKWIQFGEEAGRTYHELVAKGDKIIDPNDFAGKLSVLLQLEHLLTYPWIKSQVEKGEIRLHGWYFIIDQGLLEAWQEAGEKSGFEPLILKGA